MKKTLVTAFILAVFASLLFSSQNTEDPDQKLSEIRKILSLSEVLTALNKYIAQGYVWEYETLAYSAVGQNNECGGQLNIKLQKQKTTKWLIIDYIWDKKKKKIIKINWIR